MDNAGFVDPGGRTSDEFPMGELGGNRATEGGGRAPAASPATVPLPGLGTTESSFAPGTTAPRAGDEGSAASNEEEDRLTSATCDREAACNRVGTGKALRSNDSCGRQVAAQSKKLLACPNGVVESALASCLKTARLAPCSGGASAITSIAACQPQALCAR